MGLPGTTAQYTYTHDDAGGLERLTLPSGASYHINRMLGVGFMRITISDPDGAFAYMQDQDDHGNILSAFHPGITLCQEKYTRYHLPALKKRF